MPCPGPRRKRRAVLNHIGTVHAVAMCNMAELAGGTMTEVTIPSTHRWIPKGMTVKYLKMAKTDLVAVDTPRSEIDWSAPGEFKVDVVVRDQLAEPVFEALITMWVAPRKSQEALSPDGRASGYPVGPTRRWNPMADTPYTPPRVWTWQAPSGGRFASINRPVAGPTHDRALPVGRHPLQLYSLATPNGMKATIMLEELLEAGHAGAEYDAWLIDIGKGDQFGSGFVEVNPNSKIPALLDRGLDPPVRVFESGSILLYLAGKFGAFLPNDPAARTECLNWLFWQMGSAPFVGGGFGHFYAYAPEKYEYPINRYAMETKRQLDVLDRQLAGRRYVAGGDYTIADIAIWPWYGQLVRNEVYAAAEFLDAGSYRNVQRWAEEIAARPAVKRGRKVNRTSGDPSEQLHERHDASDFQTCAADRPGPDAGQ